MLTTYTSTITTTITVPWSFYGHSPANTATTTAVPEFDLPTGLLYPSWTSRSILFIVGVMEYVVEHSSALASLLICAVVAVYAYKRTHVLNELKAQAKTEERKVATLWREAGEYELLFGLWDKFIIGELPYSCLDGKCEQSLRGRTEKRYLRRLLLMGFLPLYVQDGGVDTQLETPIKEFDDGAWYRTKWKQGKKRACFDFLMPFAPLIGSSEDEHVATAPWREFVKALLLNEHGWRVSVTNWGMGPYGDRVTVSDLPPHNGQPMEVGATSWFEPLLPFKRDRTLEPATGSMDRSVQDYCGTKEVPGLIRTAHDGFSPIVHVEVPHYDRRKLDEMVYNFALDYGMTELFREDRMRALTAQWGRDSFPEAPACFSDDGSFKPSGSGP